MTKIVDINKHLMKRGEQMFLSCGCESSEFAVVCVSGSDAAVIACLVCAQCQKEINVEYGRIKAND